MCDEIQREVERRDCTNYANRNAALCKRTYPRRPCCLPWAILRRRACALSTPAKPTVDKRAQLPRAVLMGFAHSCAMTCARSSRRWLIMSEAAVRISRAPPCGQRVLPRGCICNRNRLGHILGLEGGNFTNLIPVEGRTNSNGRRHSHILPRNSGEDKQGHLTQRLVIRPNGWSFDPTAGHSTQRLVIWPVASQVARIRNNVTCPCGAAPACRFAGHCTFRRQSA